MKLKIFSIRPIVISFLFILSSSLFSQSASETLEIAENLIAEGNYEAAIIEGRRLLFLTDEKKKEAHYLLARAYTKSGQIYKANQQYDHAIALEEKGSLSIELIFKKIHANVRENSPIYALIELNKLADFSDSLLQQKKIFYLSVCHFKLKNFEQANYFAHALLKTSTGYDSIFLHGIFKQAIHNEAKKRVIPVISSALIPGSGQLMHGYPEEALRSFALNGSIIAISIISFYRLYFIDAFLSTYSFIRRYYISGILKTHDLGKRKKAEREALLYNELLEYMNSTLNSQERY